MTNKKGQVIFYSIMLGLVIIVLGMALAPAVLESTNNARAENTENFLGMNCTSPETNFVKAGCYVADSYIFYFVGGVIMIGGLVLTSKIIFQ